MKKRKIAWRRHILRLFLLFLVSGGVYIFLSSHFLAVGNVVVEGNTTMTTEQIYRAAGITPPVNIFTLHTDYIQARLEKDLRIKSAMVKRIFPTTLYIKVVQRKIIATVHCGYGYANLDGDGLIINAYKKLQIAKVPLITGCVFHDAYIGDQIDNPTMQYVLAYLGSLETADLAIISEVNISNPEQITAYTNGGVQIRLGDLHDPQKAARQTMEFLHNLKTIKKPIEYIDFGFDSPVLKFK